jgi:DNA polymerase (family X)
VAVPLSRTLEQLAVLAGIRGDAAETHLFSRAAAVVREHGLAPDSDPALLLHGLSASGTDGEVCQLLEHVLEAGGWVLMESAIADLPADLRWLFESGALTIEQLAALHHGLGATSAADLRAAVEEHAIRSVPGLDASVERAVGAALAGLRQAVPRIPLGRATAMADPLMAQLRSLPGIGEVSPAGSLRRGQDTVGDVEIVVSSADPSSAIEEVLRHPGIVRVLHRSSRRVYVLLERAQIGIRFVEPAVFGSTLLNLTGSATHVAALGALARDRGWRLRVDGLQPGDTALPAIAGAEEAIYAALDLPFIPPEIRENGDEIVAAQRRALPQLVSQSDLRGDLHVHSTWSDGNDSIEAMVNGCRALGYQYVAVADHSPRAPSSHNLSVRDVAAQADEIAALREKYTDIAILHSCEVDILADGTLDLHDRVLERFDLVLVSLHDRAGHGREQLRRRYLRAMRHPLVTLVTHPTNRLVGQQAPYDLDCDQLFAAAAQTGTALEIDGSPAHLDLDGVLARRATAEGAMLAISSDAHRARSLKRHMQLGITTARRGWVEPRHVINAQPLEELRALVARKRAG